MSLRRIVLASPDFLMLAGTPVRVLAPVCVVTAGIHSGGSEEGNCVEMHDEWCEILVSTALRRRESHKKYAHEHTDQPPRHMTLCLLGSVCGVSCEFFAALTSTQVRESPLEQSSSSWLSNIGRCTHPK
jgi:hypothetical protein